jgi:hypothetical protein
MRYEELRKRVQEHQKMPGCVQRERSPLIHPGFPGAFNLSFTEEPWLKEYGRYVDFNYDYVFSTVQSCIRHQDVLLIGTDQSWKYLGVFEIADLTGISSLKRKPDYAEIQNQQIHELVEFLESINIAKSQIYPSYAKGGSIKEISNNKYPFDFVVPEDAISKEAFLSAGIPKENLIPDASRDTFLCPFLSVSMPYSMPYSMPWGYRNEINVNVSKSSTPKFLDVGTIEYVLWKPKFNGPYKPENIVGIESADFGVSLVALGLERLCMAENGLEQVQDVDYIAPFYNALKQISGRENYLAGESLRALHRICADITSYCLTPSRHHKSKMRDLLRNIPEKLDPAHLKILLTIHTNTQPWHNNLQEGIEPTIERIEKYSK